MSENKTYTVVSKELEDYVKSKRKTCPKFFEKDLVAEGYKVVLIQVPKDFDVSTLEGEEINVEPEQTQILKEEENENLVIEEVDDKCENYLSNQILPAVPDSSNKIGIKKKITKVLRLYKRYNTKRTISRKNIIRQIPQALAQQEKAE